MKTKHPADRLILALALWSVFSYIAWCVDFFGGTV
jgi:hypothetical protein